MTQGALHFDALLTVNNFDQGIAKIKNGIREASGLAVKEAQVMDSAFKNLGTAIGGYLSAQSLFSFTKELINVRGEFQKTEIAFTTMLGSADKAKQLMGQMVDLAAKTPFSLQDVSAGAKQLLAFKVPANDVVNILTRLGNIAAGLGVPLERINLIYGQVKAKGKLMGGELLQFTEAGIPMIAELAEKFGKGEEEISAMVSAGKIGFKDVQDVLFKMTNEGGMFFELMEKQSASLSGKVANLGDAWDQMLNKIGEGNEGFLYAGIEQLTMLVERYDAVIEAIQTIVIAYGAYKAAIIVTSAAQSMANKTLATEIGLLGVSQRWKLGRAIVTQRQTAATLAEAQAERAGLQTKYATLQAEISSLAVKKQKAVALAIEKAQALGNAQVQLALARAELRSVTANGTAREVLIATKNVEKAQNVVIAAQESAEVTRKAALTAGTKFYNAQKEIQVVATNLNTASTVAETAAETANVAAKTANAIATQRLTIAQTLQTVAMTAAAKAASFLNATLFANPYALATALIVALAYAVYKYNTALTVAEESQKRMNDDAKTQIAGITEQEAKIKSLIKVIEDQKTTEDKRAAALKQLHSITNGRLDQLDAEAVKTGKSTEMIKEYIEMLKLEAEAKRYVNEMGRLDTDIEELNNNKDKFGFGDLWDDFTDFDSSFRWSLGKRKEERVNRIVKEKEDQKKLLQTKLDNLAKKGVNISETVINEVKPTKKAGYVEKIEAKIDELKAAYKKALTPEAARKINEEIAKWQDKLDALNPKKDKKDNKQLAEILPVGSIEYLQKQSSLLQKAYDTAIDGKVKLRKLDKYGNDKDKDGNPYLTGEIISTEEAGKKLSEISQKINEMQYKNFQERNEEAERQWNNYYKMVEFYGKKSADTQYENMFGGVQSYFEYLTKQQLALWDKKDKGILSEQEKKDIIFIEEKLRDLSGEETPLENFKRSIQNSLKSMPSLVDQVDFLNTAIEKNWKSSQSNSPDYFGKNTFLEEQKRNVLQQQKETYDTFIQEQQNFETKKLGIQQKYADFRKRIAENKTFTDKERQGLLEATNKAEAKDISAMSWELFQKTDAYVKAFGDLEKVGPRTLKKLRDELKKFLDSDAGKALNPQDLKLYNDALKNLDAQISKNPFKAVSISIKKYAEEKKKLGDAEKKYGKNSQQYNDQLQTTNLALAGIFETSGAAINGVLGFSSSLAGALGMLSEESQQALKDVEQLVDGISNAVAGYFSGNYGQMAGGIVQMVMSISSLVSGDNARERNIREWQRAVEDLKTSYRELQRVIENTAGEKALSDQRKLITNLAEQQQRLRSIREEESNKKKSDKDKVSSYDQQIRDIDMQIADLIDNFKKSVTTTEFKDLSQRIADAIVDGFAQGEDAAKSFDKVVDDVMRNAVKNALQIKILQPAMEKFVDDFYSAMGYGKSDSNANDAIKNQISNLQKELGSTEDRIKYIANLDFDERQWLLGELKDLNNKKQELLMKIANLQSQFTSNPLGGAFDGLTPEEIAKLKEGPQSAIKEFADLWKAFQESFPALNETANSLKGDIKGLTEKTGGALEGQINAMRINVTEALKVHKANQAIFNNQLQIQSQIEKNTRPIEAMYKEIKELNSKVKKGAAGIP